MFVRCPVTPLTKAIAFTALLTSLVACVSPANTTEVSLSQGGVPAGTVTSVQQTLRDMMKDPESAKFRNTQTYRSAHGDQIICGEYDAKNSFGGYTGYEMYYYRIRDGAVMTKYIDTSSNEHFKPAAKSCGVAATGVIPLPSDQVS